MVSSPSSSSSSVSKLFTSSGHPLAPLPHSLSRSPPSSGEPARVHHAAHTAAPGNEHVMRGAAIRQMSETEGHVSGSLAFLDPAEKASLSTFDTSNILYPTLQLHPAPLIHPVLVLSLSEIALVPPATSNDELFEVLLRRLEPWVGEQGEGGYILVVLAAQGNAKGKTMPGVGWWAWKWRKIPRKYVRLDWKNELV